VAERRLSGSPSTLSMFARAGVAVVPGATRLPFVAGGGGDVPDLTLVLDDVGVDRERLAAYDRVCGFDVGDEVPTTYLHVLAFPLHLSLMTDGRFPVTPIGLVHIANRITQHRPVRAGERLSLRVWATPLQPHARGRQFTLCSEARVGDELVWEERCTNLARGAGDDSAATQWDASAPELEPTATWRLPGDLGRRYGSVSGDLNPIHVHPLSAKRFGFPSAIAHGMWTKARCLAALGPRTGDAFTVEVSFRKPILLPSSVTFAEQADTEGLRFAVRGEAKHTRHLDGTLRPAGGRG
jgi:acyl dehydratase